MTNLCKWTYKSDPYARWIGYEKGDHLFVACHDMMPSGKGLKDGKPRLFASSQHLTMKEMIPMPGTDYKARDGGPIRTIMVPVQRDAMFGDVVPNFEKLWSEAREIPAMNENSLIFDHYQNWNPVVDAPEPTA